MEAAMTKTMTLNVRVSGALGEFVAANVGAGGSYENVSEYVRDLIRAGQRVPPARRRRGDPAQPAARTCVTSFRVQEGASHRLDRIFAYTRDTWGEAQAERYIRGLFERFEAIAARRFPWRPIPAEFGVDGYVCRYEKHLIYWKLLGDGSVGIVTVLRERMHQIDRFREDYPS
jgi:toxin ParE1/3/4